MRVFGYLTSSASAAISAVLVSAVAAMPMGVVAADNEWPDARAAELIQGLEQGDLKESLTSCSISKPEKNLFSISHRGAPLHYPEHTKEGYQAAASMGAGMIECDVTFTSDKALVCRHSQCDLHTTTNILETPLAKHCSSPPAEGGSAPFANVKCCTSDLTIEEFKSLRGKKDYGNKKAATLAEYMYPDNKAADDYPVDGTLLTHAESIELFKSLDVKMIPELKAAQVAMPYEGDYTQDNYAQAIVDEYIAAGISPEDVYLQSFNLDDLAYWRDHTPAFSTNAAWLDGRYRDRSFNAGNPKSWEPSMQELVDSGVGTLAPPMWMLLDLDGKKIVPSVYAQAAKAAGLNLIAWTLERSGPLNKGGGWYYQTVKKVIDDDSDTLRVLDVLAKDVGVAGVFSDWPATTTYYANCVGQ